VKRKEEFLVGGGTEKPRTCSSVSRRKKPSNESPEIRPFVDKKTGRIAQGKETPRGGLLLEKSVSTIGKKIKKTRRKAAHRHQGN